MKSKILTLFGLFVFCIIIILPPIIYGYVYPNVGDDTAELLLVLDKIKAGDLANSTLALSCKIVGYPLIWVSSITKLSMDTIFLWFNYVALASVGIVIYFVMSRLVNRRTGWLALVLTLFCAQGVFFQFYFGQIFNAINIGIILPLLLFFTVKYLTQKRVYYLILVFIFSILFSSFHTSGIYLPFFAGFAVAVYLVYCLFQRRRIQARYVPLGISVTIFSAIVFLLFAPYARIILGYTFSVLGKVMAVPVVSYMLGIVSPTILVMLGLVAINWTEILKDIQMVGKILCCILLCMVVVLGVAAFAKLSLDPFRQALDLATILALLVSVLVGVFVWSPKNRMVMICLWLMIGFGLYHNLPTWFGYNSAVRPADREAIAYVNTLDYELYSTSAEVAPWIYGRFMSKTWVKENGDLLIVRSSPMTPRTDSKNKWYEGHGIEPDASYVLDKTFTDDKVTVQVYWRQ